MTDFFPQPGESPEPYRYDRTGDRIPRDEDEIDRHAELCRGGWIVLGSEDVPQPCNVCRPHLRVVEHDGARFLTGRRRRKPRRSFKRGASIGATATPTPPASKENDQ